MKNALVAVSGGSDSLALLDMLFKKKEYNLIVAHVNYNYRSSSKRDELLVKKYCDINKIKFYVLNLDSKKEKSGNFEDWARVKRYKFFKQVYEKEKCICLFVGHQKEDVIETYLLQKKRNSLVEYYGLKEENLIQGMKVVRPLLNYTKKQLEDYCFENSLVFGIDETNFDLSYSRNQIRHEIINKMDDNEKEKLLKEIEDKNQIRQNRLKEIKKYREMCSNDENQIILSKFLKLNKNDQKEVLYFYIIENVNERISIKDGRLEDILKKVQSNKPNIILASYENITLYKEYELLVIDKNNIDYCYMIKDSTTIDINDHFYIDKVGNKLEKIIVKEEDFPLCIKNYDGSNSKVNRIFINKKIPLRLRKRWPVIVDKFGALLLVIDIKKFYNEIWDESDNPISLYVRKKR